MARRNYVVRAKCHYPGCTEVARYEASTRKEEAEIYQRYARDWLCVRHTRPDEVLSPTNALRSTELVCQQESYGRFFGGQGFISGPGFKIYAADFPAGTKLRVTAEVILPPEDPPLTN